MRLNIKKEYFDQIKKGKKKIDYRDAHITFVCLETGKEMKKQVVAVRIKSVKKLPVELQTKTHERSRSKLFTDKQQVWFYLK